MREICRTTFARQAAKVWVIKEKFWQHVLAHELGR
jgi:hypothetical protein